MGLEEGQGSSLVLLRCKPGNVTDKGAGLYEKEELETYRPRKNSKLRVQSTIGVVSPERTGQPDPIGGQGEIV